MLDDAVAGFLDAVSERGFDEPLMALLRAEGWSHVRLTHGGAEFGKDVIGQRDGEQWAWQSKAGDVGQGAFRSMAGQLDELRLSEYAHADFDLDAPRRAVLVTTGRIVGNAPLSLREYNQRAATRGEPKLEHWDRDILVGKLSGNPDAVLRQSVDGQLMSLLGAIEEYRAAMDDVDRFARRWTSWDPARLASLGVLECALLAERLVARHRLDLACQLALWLVCAECVTTAGRAHDGLVTPGERLFDVYARRLWSECDDRLLHEKWLVNASGPAAVVAYNVKCTRIGEIVSLLALLLGDRDPKAADEITSWLRSFVHAQPGAGRIIGDRYAVGLVPLVLALATSNRHAGSDLLTRATVWICDRYEYGCLGLAGHHAEPREEIERLVGETFESVALTRRRSSQAAGVVLDLAALLQEADLYADALNDVRAVNAYPLVYAGGEGVDSFLPEARSNRWDHNPDYAEVLPSDAGAAPHLPTPGKASTDRLSAWRLLAVSAALRDRHFPEAIHALLP